MTMRKLLPFLILISACADNINSKKSINLADNRPKDQISLMNRINSIRDDYFNTYENSAKLDMKIDSFTRYALDSLKDIKNWVVVINEINDNPYSANSFANGFYDLNSTPVYNLILYSTIKNYDKVDASLDSINHPQADVVFMTYTIPKQPKGDILKKQVELIKTLNRGDTLLVSGGITYINKKLKPDFSKFFKDSGEWYLDLLATDIKKN